MHPGTLSFGAAIHDFWVSRYTTWRYYLDDATGRQSLARMKQDAPAIVAMLDEEAHTALKDWASSITPTPHSSANNKIKQGWISLPINASVRPVVNQVFGRVLVGEPVCRDPRWKEASSGLGLKMMLAARDLRNVPPLLRPLACHFMHTFKTFIEARETLCRLMQPITATRCKEAGTTSRASSKSDAIQYVVNASDASRTQDVDFQLGQVFDYIFAGDNQIVNAVSIVLPETPGPPPAWGSRWRVSGQRRAKQADISLNRFCNVFTIFQRIQTVSNRCVMRSKTC